ncbi:uncharacterized protein [Anoplolepis gracilipes]|uniref:uncharacterized protein isoform X3 n=1 Tax=Anoplolepis gracilipes TaxID=354296 RepID=UPI003BA038DB
MCDKSFVLWCCALLVFSASSTKPLRNFTIDNKQDNNLIVRNKLSVNLTESDKHAVFNRYNLHKNYIMDYENAENISHINSRNNGHKDNDSIQNKLSVHYAKYLDRRNQIRIRELRADFTKIDNENYSSIENDNENYFRNENDNENYSSNENDNENYIIPYETSNNVTCIFHYCVFDDDTKTSYNCSNETTEYVFTSSNIYSFWNETLQPVYEKESKVSDVIFQGTCPKNTEIIPVEFYNNFEYNEDILFKNDILYVPYVDSLSNDTYYCWTIVHHDYYDDVDMDTCLKTLKGILSKILDQTISLTDTMNILILSDIIVTLTCTLIIFLVYYILPELNSIHSFMLRRYSSMVIISNICELLSLLIYKKYFICIASGFINYFTSLTSQFWLSLMSFDIWWTFRNILSLEKHLKKRKKLLYSIIAWGGPFILTIICIIMEFVPSVPESFRPGFNVDTCWFSFGAAELLFVYGPSTICTISNICLSIHTALKIARYEKDTARRLRDSESRCYNENKKWFNLYLKVFIMSFVLIAIQWIILTTLLFRLLKDFKSATLYIIIIGMILNIIRNIGVFIIFVCKKTIMQLLLKHFCQNRRYGIKIFKRSNFYNLEYHRVKYNYPVERYQLRQIS